MRDWIDWGSRQLFNAVHQNKLIYNACWEDPRLDREALGLGSDDTVLVITSAGCNTLDYLLDEPGHIHAVDMNPRQNALLELKIAGIRSLDFEDFFQIFGKGRHPDFETIYQRKLRPTLSASAQKIWDRQKGYFCGTHRGQSFYFRGAAGAFAKGVSHYISLSQLRTPIEWVFNVNDVQRQWDIYHRYLKDSFWKPFVRWLLRWDASLALLGVPRPQREHLEESYPGGIAKFMEDRVETVFTQLPLADNYFWWLYFAGEYTQDRCPEYLKRENFEKLQNGNLLNRITTHTGSISEVLETKRPVISHYVLLDHMDWLSGSLRPVLAREWQGIVDQARPKARVLWRSGGMRTTFVDSLQVTHRGSSERVGELLTYHRKMATRLHAKDRVHTYGSLAIADLPG